MKKLTAIFLVSVFAVMCLLVPEASCAKKKSRAKKAQTPAKTQTTQTAKKPDPHSYYKNLTQEQAEAADKVAQKIAQTIMSDERFNTDLLKVRAAANVVMQYCRRSAYGNDEKKYYRTPYGVFVAGIFTCAGATRALGRVLDFMGYDWQHANENQWSHQWCELTMDGKKGFADGMGGFAGYGEYSTSNGFMLLR